MALAVAVSMVATRATTRVRGKDERYGFIGAFQCVEKKLATACKSMTRDAPSKPQRHRARPGVPQRRTSPAIPERQAGDRTRRDSRPSRSRCPLQRWCIHVRPFAVVPTHGEDCSHVFTKAAVVHTRASIRRCTRTWRVTVHTSSPNWKDSTRIRVCSCHSRTSCGVIASHATHSHSRQSSRTLGPYRWTGGRSEARRIVEEVISFYGETPEAFVVRRHRELQGEGMHNHAIYTRLAAEMDGWRFRAPRFSERQIRRIVYG